jgi:long-chain fatty acid transport protein
MGIARITAFGSAMFWMVGGVLVLTATPVAAQFGPVLSGTGAVNRSMGGASTAAPLSAGGALFWNPATLSGLKRSELEVGVELLFPHASMSADGTGLGLGSGSSESEDAVFALPTIALAFHPEDSSFTYGLGVFAMSGFGLNYAGSTTNPIQAAPPAGLGLGPIYSEYSVLQVTPALVYEVSDQFSLSFSPVLDIATAQLDPALIASPNPPAGPYPDGTHSRTAWGGGFTLGAYYQTDIWDFGASYKSQQWFQPNRFSATDNLGAPRSFEFNLDCPSIISMGTSYKGIDGVILAADVRYLDFESTDGFGDSGFGPDLALRGLGFQNIFAVALGSQFQLTDELSVRAGYSWSGNPISSSQVTANVASPLIIQHMITFGASYEIINDFVLSLTYLHAFENSSQGPIEVPGLGPIPATSIESTASIDSIMLGATVKFGGARR